MESLNEKIKRLRKEARISQTEMAKFAGINQASYSNIEKGETKSISIEVGRGIARALNISFVELFEIELATKDTHVEDDEIKELRKQIEALRKKNEELKSENSVLSLLVKTLENEKEHIKANLVMQMVSDYSFETGLADNGLLGPENKEKRGERSRLISVIKKSFDRNKDYYIKTGFLSESDFENHYKEMRGMYENMPDDKPTSNEFHF